MNYKFPDRVYAFGYHLLFSASVAILASIFVFYVWYPGLLARASGVTEIFLMLLVIDVILGPVITLLVFNREKKELKRDLSIVVVLQLVAMVYGLHSVFIARPVYIAFTLERFDTVYANDLSPENLAKAKLPEFSSLPFFGPKYIAAPLPENPQIREAIVLEAVAGNGEDIQYLPEYYEPYNDSKKQILTSLMPLEKLKSRNKSNVESVEKLIVRYGIGHLDVGYLALKGRARNLTVIVSHTSGEVLDLVDLEP